MYWWFYWWEGTGILSLLLLLKIPPVSLLLFWFRLVDHTVCNTRTSYYSLYALTAAHCLCLFTPVHAAFFMARHTHKPLLALHAYACHLLVGSGWVELYSRAAAFAPSFSVLARLSLVIASPLPFQNYYRISSIQMVNGPADNLAFARKQLSHHENFCPSFLSFSSLSSPFIHGMVW